jgi:hypothetical protein
MPTEKQLANLRPPWKPGERVPGAGRPRKRPISEAYDDLVRSVAPGPVRAALGLGKDATWADCIALGQARRAVKGDSACAKEVREGVEGKSTQRIELGAPGKGEGVYEFVVTYENAVPGITERLQKKLDGQVIDVKPEDPSEPEEEK